MWVLGQVTNDRRSLKERMRVRVYRCKRRPTPTSLSVPSPSTMWFPQPRHPSDRGFPSNTIQMSTLLTPSLFNFLTTLKWDSILVQVLVMLHPELRLLRNDWWGFFSLNVHTVKSPRPLTSESPTHIRSVMKGITGHPCKGRSDLVKPTPGF